LPALTSADYSSFVVSGGSSVTVSAITSYSGNGTLEATGTGSILSLPNLTSITVGVGPGFNPNPALLVEAGAGGSVKLAALTQIGGGSVVLEADGSNSLLNLSALTTIAVDSNKIPQGGVNHDTLQATNGGTINDSHLTNVSSTLVIL